MAIVSQDSQARVSVLWEYFPRKAPVQFLSVKKLSHKSTQKGEEPVTPMPSTHPGPCPTVCPLSQALWKKDKIIP